MWIGNINIDKNNIKSAQCKKLDITLKSFNKIQVIQDLTRIVYIKTIKLLYPQLMQLLPIVTLNFKVAKIALDVPQIESSLNVYRDMKWLPLHLTVLTAVTSGRLTTSGWLHGAVQMYNAAQPTRCSF